MERQLTAQALTCAAWAPFGWIPLPDTDPADGESTLEFTWNDPHVNIIHHGADEIVRTEDGLICDRMYRHATHTQTLLALGRPSVIAVAPPGCEFSDASHSDAIMSFLIAPYESFVLHSGTWHWGPFPLGEETVSFFNVQGKNYAEDNECVDLESAGCSVIIRAAAA